jgi:hypothetical protein
MTETSNQTTPAQSTRPTTDTSTSRNRFLWPPVIVSALVFLLSFVFAFWLPEGIRKDEAKNWKEPLLKEMTNLPSVDSVDGSEPEKGRLKEQVTFLVNRADHHFQIMMYFYSNYYVDLLLCAILSGWAALSLFLVSRAGWDKTHPVLMGFFLSTTVCAAFFFGFSKMCKQEENVAENKALFLKYVELLNDARTFVATQDYTGRSRSDEESGPVTTAAFILYLDQEMKKANNIMISFDPEKIPAFKISDDAK